MKISEHVYGRRLYFYAETPAGVMKRNVFMYLIRGTEKNILIDSGVASSTDNVFELIKEAGLEPGDIDAIYMTHAHVDHIGGLAQLKSQIGCKVYASELSRPWIEDIDKQFKERPVPQFYDFVKESVKLDGTVVAGDLIDLGDSQVEVFALPGHEKGQLGYFHRGDGVLISGDSVPVAGEVPIYDSVTDEVAALRTIGSIPGLETLLLSWDDVKTGKDAAKETLDSAIGYVRKIQSLTQEGLAEFGDDTDAVAKYVHNKLGLPPNSLNALFYHAIEAHMRDREIRPEDIEF